MSQVSALFQTVSFVDNCLDEIFQVKDLRNMLILWVLSEREELLDCVRATAKERLQKRLAAMPELVYEAPLAAPVEIPQSDWVEAREALLGPSSEGPIEALSSPVAGRIWSREQEAIFQAVTAQEGHLVVTARAGCGKTTTIIEAIKRYLALYPINRVLFCSFANKIVKEARQKLEGLPVDVMSYHSLGNLLLRNNKIPGRTEGDSEQGQRQYDLTMRSLPFAPNGSKTRVPKEIFKMISEGCRKAREVEPFLDDIEDCIELLGKYNIVNKKLKEPYDIEYIASYVLKAVKLAKSKYDLRDFADMIFLPNVLELGAPIYDLIVVDECQDTSQAMLNIARSVLKSEGKFVAIGDPAQAIYSWRGADSYALQNLKEAFNAAELKLTVTYRCPRSIVALAQKHVPDYVSFSSENGTIEDCTLGDIYKKAEPGKTFILSRTNAPLVRPCLALLKQGKQAKILGKDLGRDLIENIKSLASGLTMEEMAKHGNSISALCAKIDKQTQDLIQALEYLKEKNEELYDSKVEQLRDKASFVLSFFEGEQDSTIKEVIEKIQSVFADEDEKGCIVLSSVHKIKGLEAEKVFMLEDTFKFTTEEEKNIWYVAVTRSKSELYMVKGVK